jgi:hypothetical protein
MISNHAPSATRSSLQGRGSRKRGRRATGSGNRSNMRGLLARLLDNAGLSRRLRDGELSEWPKEPDSKSGVRVTVPRVRIPRSPPQSANEQGPPRRRPFDEGRLPQSHRPSHQLRTCQARTICGVDGDSVRSPCVWPWNRLSRVAPCRGGRRRKIPLLPESTFRNLRIERGARQTQRPTKKRRFTPTARHARRCPGHRRASADARWVARRSEAPFSEKLILLSVCDRSLSNGREFSPKSHSHRAPSTAFARFHNGGTAQVHCLLLVAAIAAPEAPIRDRRKRGYRSNRNCLMRSAAGTTVNGLPVTSPIE